MSKYLVKKSENNVHECIEPCPVFHEGPLRPYSSVIMIGSGACQSCKHHKWNNKERDGLSLIECDELNKIKSLNEI